MAVVINKRKAQQPEQKEEKKIDILFKDGEVYDLEKIEEDKKRNGDTAISIGVDSEKIDAGISVSSKKEPCRISADDCKRILFDE